MIRKLRFVPGIINQKNMVSTGTSGRFLMVEFGKVEAVHEDKGTCAVRLSTGFLARKIKILSKSYCKDDIGSIEYPPLGSAVKVIYPQGTMNEGWIEPVHNNYANESTRSITKGSKTMRTHYPGGWKSEYKYDDAAYVIEKDDIKIAIDKEKKMSVAKGEKMKMEIDPSAASIVIEDFNGNKVEMTGTGVKIVTGDAGSWMPNTLPVDTFTGVPHGGPGAGINKLKGG